MFAQYFQVSRADKPPLRVGLLLDTPVLPRCCAEIVDQIRGSNFARLELVVLNAEVDVPTAGSLPTRIFRTLSNRNSRRRMLFNLYERWDDRSAGGPEDPLAPVDCSDRLRDIPSIAVEPERVRFVHRFPPDAVALIREHDLDVIVRFGFNILRGEILNAARFGVWSYHHGDNDRYRGGPAGFWEVYEGNPASGAMLQVLTEDLDAGTVLCKCLVGTQLGLSMARNRIGPYWAANAFVIQKLRELHEHGWEYVQSRVVPPRRYQGKKRVYTAPSNREMAAWLVPLIAGKVARRISHRPRMKQWSLAMRRGAGSLLDDAGAPAQHEFRGIQSPAGRFYADPFLIEEGGRPWLFFEDFDCTIRRGQISAAEIGEDDEIGEPVQVLSRPYHLSYPCVFRDGDDLFMIPESGANRNVELYSCRRFPDRWTLEKELFRGRAVDTSIWVQDGLYWFFVTLVESRGRGQQLWLFSAESLTGAWTPHPANPISTDLRNSRGAGAIFRHKDQLIRPSQDGGEEYGRSFAFNEIMTLTPDRYEERPGVKISPMKGFVGTHTYSRAGQVEIIDASALLPKAPLFRSKGGINLRSRLAVR